MSGEVEAHGIGLERESFQRCPVGNVRQTDGFGGLGGRTPEQTDLAAGLFLLVCLCSADDCFGYREQTCAVCFDGVESAGTDQVFELGLVNLFRIDAGCEVGEVGEGLVAT